MLIGKTIDQRGDQVFGPISRCLSTQMYAMKCRDVNSAVSPNLRCVGAHQNEEWEVAARSLAGAALPSSSARQASGSSCEIRLRRRTQGIEPAAYVHLRVRFTAVMPCSGGIRRRRVPAENGELRGAALDYKPMTRIVRFGAAHFASVLVSRRHRLVQHTTEHSPATCPCCRTCIWSPACGRRSPFRGC